jgi:single-strand DNA-binding protein
MSNVNFVHMVGNLTEDPELRYTHTSQKPVANMRIGVNDRVQRNGEWVSIPTFINVVAWDQLAENTAMSASKGDRISVQGRLTIRSYDGQDGVKHYRTEIIADSIAVELRFQVVGDVDSTNTKPAEQPVPAGGVPAEPVYGDEEPF